MRTARARDVFVKTSTPTRKVVRTCVTAIALGVGIFSSAEVRAQVVDAPPHRIDFKVSPGLTKCNDYEAFYGILLNWVRVRSINQAAEPSLVVDIQQRPDGGKNVKLALLDASGAELASELHRYSPSEECFKVLYWTAWDSAKLLRTVAAPTDEEKPSISPDKLTSEAARLGNLREKSGDSGESCPIYDPEFYSQSKPEPPKTPGPLPPAPSKHWVAGFGLTAGLTRAIMPTLRFGFGKTSGHMMFEANVHVMPPVIAVPLGSGANGSAVSNLAHGYLGNVALCAKYSPLFGCLVVSGGVAGYTYDASQSASASQRFVEAGVGGAVLVGLRNGVEFTLNPKWSLRIDASVELPIYISDVLRPPTPQGQSDFTPVLAGFVSAVPHW